MKCYVVDDGEDDRLDRILAEFAKVDAEEKKQKEEKERKDAEARKP